MKWNCALCDRSVTARVRPTLCDCGGVDCFLVVAAVESAFKSAAEVSNEILKRYPTGDATLDALTLGGIPAKARILVWGRGGSGKSRCALRWATRIGRTACVSLEMTEADCKRCALEAGGKLSNLLISTDEAADLPRGVRCIVYDSISEAKDPTLALERLKAWATRTSGLVFVVCHATKAGQFRGPSTLQHWGEAEFKVSASKSQKGHARVRVLKSRFCPGGAVTVPLVGLHAI